MDGGVDVDDDGGEGGEDLDGHQDMKLEGLASALEEVSTPSEIVHHITSLIIALPITYHLRGH